MSLKERIAEDMKAAMRAKETAKLGAIRLLMAAMKQREVDERITLDDAAIIAITDKQLKQRRDSLSQYEAAGRADLADVERYEIEVLSAYMPAGLSEAEIDAAIQASITETGATGPADMGKLMAALKPKLAGRADMGAVSAKLKIALAK
ncbi:GatB/YqeY domain-containing protein [Uliginosibacterium flavum]|uniref:GatB/YqeY domain-containing protein n=1 Tax=Uliginosibacterium flavum TaxID=1396831 RepID=A0ABV2TP70_9RHOO